MSAVKIADLKNNLSRHLATVRDGEEITVLDRETPIARIIPFAPRGTAGKSGRSDDYWTDDRLADLERQGIIVRGDRQAAARGAKEVKPARLPAGSKSAVALLLEMRRQSTR